MAENPTTSEGVAAESGETVLDNTALYNTDSEILIELLNSTQSNGDTLIDIETELITLRKDNEILQGQLAETYKLLAFIFLLLIIFGVYKFFSGLLNTA